MVNPQVFPPGTTRGYAWFNLYVRLWVNPQVFPPGTTRGYVWFNLYVWLWVNPQVFPSGATRGYAWFNLFEVAVTCGFFSCQLTDNRQKTVGFISLLS